MKRFSVQNLWRNLTGGHHEASSDANLSESNSNDVVNVTQTTRQSSDNISINMPTQPPSHPESQVSDGDKAGAMLLFSGIFLSLVGMTFTSMGWINYEVSSSFEWTQLLGPILLSVGGTFVFISICKFRLLSCQTCKMVNDEGMSEIDLPPLSGPSFVFSSVNQPITFHRATVVQYIPPPYASVAQDRDQNPINRFQSSQQPLAVTVTGPPKYYSIYPMGNPAFTDDNETQDLAERRENRIPNQSEEVEEEKTEASDISPPAYDDIYPTTSCDNSFK